MSRKSPRRLQTADLVNASEKLKNIDGDRQVIFSFSNDGTIHGLFMIKFKEMTQTDGLRYVEFSIEPLRQKRRMSEIIFSCFFEGPKFKLASIEPMFDFHFEELYKIMKGLPTSPIESMFFDIATEIFRSKFEITMYSRDMFISGEDDEPLFNPYFSRVPTCLSVMPFKKICHKPLDLDN